MDSPLAADFTAGYTRLREHWDREARRQWATGRHPLAFEQVLTMADHATHLQTVAYLARTGRPAAYKGRFFHVSPSDSGNEPSFAGIESAGQGSGQPWPMGSGW